MRLAAAPAWRHAAAGVLILCGLLFSGIRDSNGMWAAASDVELVNSADLIVMGEWRSVSSDKYPDSPTIIGTITISEVLKGKSNSASVSIAQSFRGTARSSSDLDFSNGDQGLWLLRRVSERTDIYLIDHPQRFIPGATGEARIRTIRSLIAR